LGRILRGVRPVRDRLHHEPVHHFLGVRAWRTRGTHLRRPTGHPLRFLPLRARRLSGAAVVAARKCISVFFDSQRSTGRQKGWTSAIQVFCPSRRFVHRHVATRRERIICSPCLFRQLASSSNPFHSACTASSSMRSRKCPSSIPPICR